MAAAAATAKKHPTDERNILPPGEGVGAVAAVGAGVDDALAGGPAAQAHVEEAAEGEAQQAGEYRCENANHARVEYTGV